MQLWGLGVGCHLQAELWWNLAEGIGVGAGSGLQFWFPVASSSVPWPSNTQRVCF